MLVVGLATASAAAGLAGCASGSGFAELDRPAEARDGLPSGLPAEAYDQLDAESARFVGNDRGARLYLMKGAESGICLLVWPEDDRWFSGCGGDHFTVANPTRTYEVWADGALPVKGATQLSPNVFATR